VVEYALSRSLSPALVAEYQTRLPDRSCSRPSCTSSMRCPRGNRMKQTKKLIEVSQPLPESRRLRHMTKCPVSAAPKGIHHWWARHPLPVARAFSSRPQWTIQVNIPRNGRTEDAQKAERERLFDIIPRMMGKKLHEHPEILCRSTCRDAQSVRRKTAEGV